MKYFQTYLIIALFVASASSQNTPILEGLTGDDLFNALRQEYKPSIVQPYNNARDILFGQIDKVNDSLECIYSGYKVFLPAGQDPTTAACEGDGCPGINTEHVYPQSLWNGDNNPRADMHHLFPTKAAVNSARASEPFGDIVDNLTDTWYYKDLELSSIPTSNKDLYSEDRNGVFEPRESSKGDVARAMFYFYTMYRTEANAVDPDFFNDQVATLCEWHNNDNASLVESIRTWKIAQYQDGKPNPFVLDCTLASRLYCSSIGWYCNTITSQEDLAENASLSLSPNPARNTIFIEWENSEQTETLLSFYDVTGKEIRKEIVENMTEIDIHELPKGMIVAKLQFGNRITTRKFIHL